MLEASKSEIRDYATRENIGFREDSTNTDTDYQRNYLRHEVLPKFETINTDYRSAITNFIEYSEELKSWIDNEVEKFLGRISIAICDKCLVDNASNGMIRGAVSDIYQG